MALKKKERELARLSELYRQSKFEVARLKAPNAIKERLEGTALELTTPKAREVVRVLTPKHMDRLVRPEPTLQSQFLSWLSFVGVAQAKTVKE